MPGKPIPEEPVDGREEQMRRLVTIAKRLDAETSRTPDADSFYILDGVRVYGMTVVQLSRISGVSQAMLHYFLNGRAQFGSLMTRHIGEIVGLSPLTLKELGKAVRHERARRYGKVDSPCLIPGPLFHYFKKIEGIGPSPKMEGKYKEMVESRKGNWFKPVNNTAWFQKNAEKIAIENGFKPDANGIYRKDKPTGLVQAFDEIRAATGLDDV